MPYWSVAKRRTRLQETRCSSASARSERETELGSASKAGTARVVVVAPRATRRRVLRNFMFVGMYVGSVLDSDVVVRGSGESN